MCGFAGIYNPRGYSIDSLNESIRKMTQSLAHRGPDSEGYWCEENGSLVLGHQRLAIEDLNHTGNQPMVSSSGRFVIAFNGEIYNHKELRIKLHKTNYYLNWKGTSDTETFINSIEVWGIEKTITQSIGMFSFSLWDRQTKTLTLGRDRMGEKPLYYGWLGNTFIFSSELRAIEKYSNKKLNISYDSLDLFFQFSYIPGPKSIYTQISKLKPGCLLKISPNNKLNQDLVEYWSLIKSAEHNFKNPFNGTENEAILEFEKIFSKSVKRQMFADVPVGAFLSGGIDSAAIVSEMVKYSDKVNTFTIGLNQVTLDERDQARRVAKRLGTTHHEGIVTEFEAMEIVTKLGLIYDEPFSDSSQIPTILLSRFAREKVVVALSGDGGDELFGGYPRHLSAIKHIQKVNLLPFELRKSLGQSLYNIFEKITHNNLDSICKLKIDTRKVLKFANILKSSNTHEAYINWVSHWMPYHQILCGRNNRVVDTSYLVNTKWVGNLDRELMLIDALTYLIDEILVKVDRASMSVSLETRAPFLDAELIEFSLSLPLNHIFNGVDRKLLLRKFVQNRILPISLSKNKRGFSVPLAKWLKGGLREWAEDNFSYQPSLDFMLNEKMISKIWKDHLRGTNDYSPLIWSVLMFKNWAKERGI